VLARRRPDPVSRATGAALAVGRFAIGGATAFATPLALRVLGFADAGAGGRALARMTGARDIALAGLVAGSLGDRKALRAAAAASTFADAGDAAAFAFALVRRDGIDRAAVLGLASASAATAAGLWLDRRLA